MSLTDRVFIAISSSKSIKLSKNLIQRDICESKPVMKTPKSVDYQLKILLLSSVIKKGGRGVVAHQTKWGWYLTRRSGVGSSPGEVG